MQSNTILQASMMMTYKFPSYLVSFIQAAEVNAELITVQQAYNCSAHNKINILTSLYHLSAAIDVEKN